MNKLQNLIYEYRAYRDESKESYDNAKKNNYKTGVISENLVSYRLFKKIVDDLEEIYNTIN